MPPDGFTLAPFARAGVRVEPGQTVAVDIRLQWGGNLGTPGDDHPNGFCLPGFVIPGGPLIFQIIQTDAAMVTLFENVPNYRQVYLDGRPHPKDPNPSWTGHSVGRWEGNALVIDTVGFNDKSWAEIFPHTEKLHVVERYTRPDRGHLRIDVTMEDAGTFVRPWRTHATWTLAPGHEVFEYVCAENNRMLPRSGGN